MSISQQEFFTILQRKLEILQLEKEDESESISEQQSQRYLSEIMNLGDGKNYDIDLPLMSNGKILNKYDGMSINDFNVGATLGTGTFGRVRQVTFKSDKNNEVYALKMLKKTEIVRLNQVEHINSEKNILMGVQYPFIVQIKGCFQDEKYIYMLFEYVQGGELFSRLRKEGRFANDVGLFYACEILMTLQYLSKQEIVYRDLKPENLLIDKEGHVKITDFGFAKQLKNDRTYTLCGTPEYLAPEIIKGNKVGYGKSVDWWAFGILIFEMLSGYPPFYDNEPIGIYKKIIAGIIEFPRFFELRAKDVIRKLLNPEIKLRLGVNDYGQSILKHKWFKGVDWDAVERKAIPAPWIPFLKNDQDASWFEKYPDSKNPAQQLPDDLQPLFDNF